MFRAILVNIVKREESALKKLVTSLVIGVLLLCPATSAIAATSQDVTVTATPSFISISNSPGSYDFGLITESGTPNTGTGYFTVTNTSTVATDINIGCDLSRAAVENGIHVLQCKHVFPIVLILDTIQIRWWCG